MAKIRGTIDTYNRQKKCMKVTFIIEDKDSVGVASKLDAYLKKPITLEVLVDGERMAQELTRITPEQRAKIFALIKDIASHTGEGKENMREILEGMYCDERQIETFSLSDCSQDVAGGFIEWLINFAFEQGVGLSENPVLGLKDVSGFLRACVSNKKSMVCGKDGMPYKVQGREINYCMCDTHFAEAQKLGVEAFDKKYHFGI